MVLTKEVTCILRNQNYEVNMQQIKSTNCLMSVQASERAGGCTNERTDGPTNEQEKSWPLQMHLQAHQAHICIWIWMNADVMVVSLGAVYHLNYVAWNKSNCPKFGKSSLFLQCVCVCLCLRLCECVCVHVWMAKLEWMHFVGVLPIYWMAKRFQCA